MLYHSIAKTSQRSTFKLHFDLQTRRQKREGLEKRTKAGHCFLVVEYVSGVNSYRKYELMCVDGGLKLRILQQFLMRKLKEPVSKHHLIIEVGGKIKNPNESIGDISYREREQDGFLYLFLRNENSF